MRRRETPPEGGTIGSAKGAVGFINGVSPDEVSTYTFIGSGGSPEVFAAAFSRGESPAYLVVSERFFSGMTLPLDRPIKVHGEANPGATVTVSTEIVLRGQLDLEQWEPKRKINQP